MLYHAKIYSSSYAAIRSYCLCWASATPFLFPASVIFDGSYHFGINQAIQHKGIRASCGNLALIATMITSFFQICPNALLITCKNNSISNLWNLSYSIAQVQSWPKVGEGVANSQLYQETVVWRFQMTNQSGLISQSSPATNYKWEVTFLQRKYTCLRLRSSWVPEVTPHLDAHLGSTASFRCTAWILHRMVWTIQSTMVWICVFLKALESNVSNLLWQFRDPETL